MRRRSLTLIEVAIAAAILALVLGISLGASLSASASNAALLATAELDQTGRRLFAQLRRELHQSGTDATSGTDRVESPASGASADLTAGDALTFQTRIAIGSADPEDDWGADPSHPKQKVRYRLVADGQVTGVEGGPYPRYRLVRERLDAANNVLETVRVCTHITEFRVTRDAGSRTVLLEVRFTRQNTQWRTGTPPDPIHREFRERIALLNG